MSMFSAIMEKQQKEQKRREIRMGKQICRTQDFYLLEVYVHKATDKDNLTLRRKNAVYRVYMSDRTGFEENRLTIGRPDPMWRSTFLIRYYYDEVPRYLPRFIYFDVVEENCFRNETGTSTGAALKGSARIQMPRTPDIVESRTIELVKLEKGQRICGGSLELQVRLSKHVDDDEMVID